jgi:hypothetical protein
LKIEIYKRILSSHIRNNAIFTISTISYSPLSIHFSSTEQFNKAFSNPAFFGELGFAWMFIAGLFAVSMVIMIYCN